MGIQPLPMLLSLLAAATPLSEPQPMAEERFQQWLLESDLQQLELGCSDPLIGAAGGRQQQIRDRLLVLHPAPDSFELVAANATALLTCGSPDSAARVLNRISPAVGEERRRWLRLRWQAAAAGLDHREAALALRRLVNGDLIALASLELGDGRLGLDQLAEHEAALGRQAEAASVLLLAPNPQRLAQAADWLAGADAAAADQLLEQALDQAAADQAWGLAVELLELQLSLQLAAGGDGARPRQRLQRLAAQLDDRYSLWRLEGGDELDLGLRSPRQPGGHAAVGDSPDAPSP
ncbi:MAG: hypothetical protein ED554_07220 [Synechococcus sp. YX04-3]|nr:MAG: hypothetical protein ED554_07220 [Synechococcus sp. YX04-3]